MLVTAKLDGFLGRFGGCVARLDARLESMTASGDKSAAPKAQQTAAKKP